MPTPEAYAPAVAVLERMRVHLAGFGVQDRGSVDLVTALIGGLVDAQQANDPGGDRWGRLLDDALDLFADHVGLPTTTTRPRSTP